MKIYALLLILVTRSLLIFSQSGTLQPIVHLKGIDTLLCFDVNQSKDIAKKIAAGESCISEVKQYEHIVVILDSLILTKDRQIILLKETQNNNSLIHQEQQKIAEGYKEDARSCNKKIRRHKIISIAATTVAVIFVAISVVR